jgi:hypothetical protein
MTFPVKWHSSEMGDHPDITEFTPGGLFNVLKGCLILGFNTQVPTGMTYDGGADEITVEFGVAHGYIAFQIIDISGADQAAYTGEFRVKAISATAITVWPHNGTPAGAATTATAFSCYCPPVDGWEVLYEVGTPTFELHLGRTDPNATQYKFLLYNDMTYDTSAGANGSFIAKVSSVENYVDNLTFDIKHTAYWAAGYRYSDTGEEWMLCGDKYQFYWTNKYAQNEGNYSTYTFGDINSVVKDDTGHCIINGCQSNGSDGRWNNEGYRSHVSWTQWKESVRKYMMTDYSGQSAIVTWQMQGIHTYSANTFTYPNPASHGFHVFAGPILCNNGTTVRGHMPGLMQPLHRNDMWHRKIVDQLPGLEGVPVIFWQSSYSSQNDAGVYRRLTCWRLDDWQRDVDL